MKRAPLYPLEHVEVIGCDHRARPRRSFLSRYTWRRHTGRGYARRRHTGASGTPRGNCIPQCLRARMCIRQVTSYLPSLGPPADS